MSVQLRNHVGQATRQVQYRFLSDLRVINLKLGHYTQDANVVPIAVRKFLGKRNYLATASLCISIMKSSS